MTVRSRVPYRRPSALPLALFITAGLIALFSAGLLFAALVIGPTPVSPPGPQIVVTVISGATVLVYVTATAEAPTRTPQWQAWPTQTPRAYIPPTPRPTLVSCDDALPYGTVCAMRPEPTSAALPIPPGGMT